MCVSLNSRPESNKEEEEEEEEGLRRKVLGTDLLVNPGIQEKVGVES